MPTYLLTLACACIEWSDRPAAKGSKTTCLIHGATTVRTSERWTP